MAAKPESIRGLARILTVVLHADFRDGAAQRIHSSCARRGRRTDAQSVNPSREFLQTVKS